MRLLNSRTLEFKEFVDEESAPKYAILSHTWEDDEVTFKDMQEGRKVAKSKAGFRKIDWCAKQALEDGLNFFWVDTCCIDKSSSAELSEAINSMFRWYKNSGVCYAYLSDVPAPKWINDRRRRKFTDRFNEVFVSARWFTRGWTLQELIAPSKLIFYNSSWDTIGAKEDFGLNALITRCTGIPRSALTSGGFFEYSVAQRMSWAATRSTTRVEDMSYCLMGLFEINMPLLYGEGKHAFIRLQEEIIRRSDDVSIFVWTDPDAKFSTYRGLLARRPSDFAWCKDVAWHHPEESPEPVITSKGIKLTDVNLKPRDGMEDEFVIHFPGVTTTKSWVGIYLQKLSKSQFVRVDPNLVDHCALDNRKQDSYFFANKVFGTQKSTIFVRERPILTDPKNLRLGEVRLSISEAGGRDFYLERVVPQERWDAKTKVFTFRSLEELQSSPLIEFLLKSPSITITFDGTKKLESCISIETPLRGTRDDSKICSHYETGDGDHVWITIQPQMIDDDHLLHLEISIDFGMRTGSHLKEGRESPSKLIKIVDRQPEGEMIANVRKRVVGWRI